eukprot:31160-Pelagococcus_subviridis.AAC.21
MFTRPCVRVSSVPCRAARVGNVLSNVSAPCGTPARMDVSSPMPSTCVGRSLGSNGITYAMSSPNSVGSLPRLPPIANPSNGSEDKYSALSFRNAASTPPWTTAYIACRRTSS